MTKSTDKVTTKKTKTKGESSGQVTSLINVSLDEFSIDNYTRYGRSVLEDRAIPDFRDGLTPVNRRVLWSAYTLGIRSNSKFVKSARIIGDVLGRYHPHGDSSAYGAMVGMTNVGKVINNIIFGLIDGEGNWGNLSERSPAAMRYTEARLSKFSDAVLFDKFYAPVIDTAPNYDNSTVEPLVLPALLPILFLNGKFGIAPGATANIPSFDPKTLLSVLHDVYNGEEITSKFLSKKLRLVSKFGGVEHFKKGDEKREALFTGTRGAVVLHSDAEYDDKKRTITVTRFANSDVEKIILKVSAYDGVQSVQDLSDTVDTYGRVVIQLRRLPDDRCEKLVEKIKQFLTLSENYVLNFTRRYKDETGQAQAKMKAMNLVTALTNWVSWRTKLEQRACAYWIEEDVKEIRRLELLIQAVDLIDFIVKLLKDKRLDTDQFYAAYMKKAKVKLEEAKYVLSRPIISLRNLEQRELAAKVKETQIHQKGLEKRRDTPKPHMAEQLKSFKAFL